MRFTLLLALLAFPAFADEKPKPNTLTPKEIADGWILLFDGETTFGWSGEGVRVADGILELDGRQGKSAYFKSNSIFGNSTLKFAFAGSATELLIRCNGPQSISWPVEEAQGWCATQIDVDGDGKKFWWRTLREQVGEKSRIEDLFRPNPAEPSDIRIGVSAGDRVRLHSIKLKPSKQTPLCNAKDLTGWKTYDPAKAKVADSKAKEVKVASKYSVTKEGWLNVKDGGGDLQTEGQWADFVLQFECISNGKHLNSGMFFRCIPDLYQQGYEAQIRNEWMGDDRTKPVDYGTGAIYRRQATRKVVSTDGEWFTMTVAAHGRHIATWVNGYQTVDWTDDRKEADNARQGFKKSKGALSIQGHDPTTDLSFRNIRIQSLDSK